MNVQVNDKNEIIGYAIVGSIVGGEEVDDTVIPPYFFEGFEPKKYKLIEGEVFENERFIPPTNKPIVEIDIDEISLKKMFLTLQNCFLDNTKEYPVFDMLKAQWKWDLLTFDDLKSYVDNNLITKEQYAAITNETY